MATDTAWAGRMTDARRRTYRLARAGTGWLAAPRFRAAAMIENISVDGARVRVLTVSGAGSEELPRELTLTTVLARERVTLEAVVMRAERETGGLFLAVRFLNGEAVGLEWLINQAQREDIFGPPEQPGPEPWGRSDGRRKRGRSAEADQGLGQDD
jgi:hypothetical protein